MQQEGWGQVVNGKTYWLNVAVNISEVQKEWMTEFLKGSEKKKEDVMQEDRRRRVL